MQLTITVVAGTSQSDLYVGMNVFFFLSIFFPHHFNTSFKKTDIKIQSAEAKVFKVDFSMTHPTLPV